MPLYEYVCKDCDHHFESFRAMKDADQPIHCKNCMSPNTRRALSKCNSSSSGKSQASTSSGCGGCSGGSCSHCGH